MSDNYKSLRVERIVEESWNTKSFYLCPADGSPIEAYAPGQHLLFSLPVDIAEPDLKMMRFYTLSDCYRSGGAYRITVKHEVARDATAPDGLGSSYLHAHITEGDTVQAKGPMGDFTLDASGDDPVVLIAGGIGITPIIAMAQAIAAAGNQEREVHVFLGMRNREDHPFKDEFAALTRNSPSIQLNVCYDDLTAADVLGSDYDFAERVSVDLLKTVLPNNRYNYYICGPLPMMDALTGDLATWGVAEGQIFTESFGPATASHLIEQSEAGSAAGGKGDAASDVIEVNFSRNGVTHTWDSRYKSLLEFAEAKGVAISAGCLYGDCGTCMTSLKAGAVEYNHPTEITPDDGCCLPCSCKPTTSITLEA
jgi:ferredoxin-NADP reductase